MKYPVNNVFIIGGTGFLGYYFALEFLKKGIAVIIVRTVLDTCITTPTATRLAAVSF